MNQILITGLDGSGKSTVLSKLKETRNDSVEFIFVPHIETDSLDKGSKIYRIASFINNLSLEADKNQIPQLKAIALFASMLIFNELVQSKIQTKTTTVFFERHPLIDTGIYAQFYASKLEANSLSSKTINHLDTQFAFELEYILSLIPSNLIEIKESKIISFMHFIYSWFYESQKFRLNDLKLIFDIELPTQIYFLKADVEVLYSRIKDRNIKEAHENLAVLDKLNKAYVSFFEELTNKQPNLVKIIDANNTRSLDNFAKQLSIETSNR